MARMLWRALTQLILYTAFLTAISFATSDSATSPIVDLGYVKYKGTQTAPNTVVYYGVPYAEPPVGPRRFRATVPLNKERVSLEAKGKILDATSSPAFCIQGTTGNGDAGGAGSEDCLKVNVYTPKGARAGDKLPVLVYIHGGAYIYGNPTSWPFDHWVNQSPNLIVVSVYYRLSSFGFLSHPAFSSTSVGDHNTGILDQREALRWVQENIHSFGGDKNKVTIYGQSAGGASIHLHLVSPSDKNLFHSVIAESVYRTPIPTPEQQQPLFDFYAEQAGCGSNTTSVEKRMACLRAADVSALAHAQDAKFAGPYNAFHPVLDGKVVTIRPTEAFLAGKFPQVPLLTGSTSNETLSGGDFGTALKTFFPLLADSDIDQYQTQYPLDSFQNVSQQVRVATGQSELICAAEISSKAYTKRGGSPVWVYRYNTRNPTGSSPFVEHSADNWMKFRGANTGPNGTVTFTPFTPSEQSFSEELIAYWTSFARSGNPNTYKLPRSPAWAQYESGKPVRNVLQEGTESKSASYLESVPELEQERCKFVAGLVKKHQA